MAEPVSASIAAHDLSFSYRRGVQQSFHLAIQDWQIARGEQVALYGPSGCGKSTLLSLLAGVLVPEAGRLVVEGGEMQSMSDDARRAHRIRRLGFVFQDSPLVDYLDALENVLFPFRLNRALRLGDSTRRRARELLEQLGLGDKVDRRPGELSQGERQRVGIARALVAQPALVLADEPTSGLDPEASTHVVDLLLRLSAERAVTLLVVTHDPAVRSRFEKSFDVSLWSGGTSGTVSNGTVPNGTVSEGTGSSGAAS